MASLRPCKEAVTREKPKLLLLREKKTALRLWRRGNLGSFLRLFISAGLAEKSALTNERSSGYGFLGTRERMLQCMASSQWKVFNNFFSLRKKRYQTVSLQGSELGEIYIISYWKFFTKNHQALTDYRNPPKKNVHYFKGIYFLNS